MKKILTLIAALILTFSFSAVTFAQESPAAPAPSGTAIEKTKKAPAVSKKKSKKKKKHLKSSKKSMSSKKSIAIEPAPAKATP